MISQFNQHETKSRTDFSKKNEMAPTNCLIGMNRYIHWIASF